MKQLFYAALAAIASAVALTACKTPKGSMTLGNITWASVHVDDYRTFATRPDMYTKFYQWGKNKAWSATDSIVTEWDATHDTTYNHTIVYQWINGEAWSATWGATDSLVAERKDILATSYIWTVTPCPERWRLPTEAEYEALSNAGGEFDGKGGVWAAANTRGNAVAGCFFGVSCATCSLPSNMSGCVFFPASGYRYTDGVLERQGNYGRGWSCSSSVATIASNLYFKSDFSIPAYNSSKLSGFPVRCVREFSRH